MTGEFMNDLQQFFYTRAENSTVTPEYQRLNREFIEKFECIREYLGFEKWSEFESIIHAIESDVQMTAYKQGFSDGMQLTNNLKGIGV